MANGKDFVDRIDMLLKQKNIKRLALATEIGQTVQCFTDWKRRDSVPSADIAVRIASALGTTVEYLVTGTEPPKETKIPDDLQAVINKYASGQ